MYFNFFDAAQKRGGFVRIGNRRNERYAKTTICLYERDGSVLFNVKRAEIADNARFEAGGMRFAVETPFERLQVGYRGKARGGFLHRGRTLTLVRDIQIDTGCVGEEEFHDRIRVTLTCMDGQKLEVTGRVLSLIPLRNRKNGKTTRISEGMTEWSCEGRTGYGLSEYLDQLPAA
jgi:hypothetical protein